MMKFMILLMFIFFILSFILFEGVRAVQRSPEKELINKLTNDYDPRVRPTDDVSLPISINFSISFKQILDLNENTQVVKLSMYLLMNWKDDFLTWNYTEYDGIKDISLPATDVWTPDILTYDSVASSFDQMLRTNVVVNDNGTVRWHPVGVFESSCYVDITRFPYDEQTCNFTFGSWSYPQHQLDLNLEEEQGRTTFYVESEEFHLISINGKKNSTLYESSDIPFSDITYYLRVRRRRLFYEHQLMLPCFLLFFLSTFVFLLPIKSGERISFLVTLLLAQIVYLQLVQNNLHPSDKVNGLVKAYVCNILMVAVSIIVAVFSFRFFYNELDNAKKAPKWIRRLIRHKTVNWFLRLNIPDKLSNDHHVSDNNDQCSARNQAFDQSGEDGQTGKDVPCKKAICIGGETNNETSQPNQSSESNNEKITELEWKCAGAMLDRIWFWVFLIYLTLATSICLLVY